MDTLYTVDDMHNFKRSEFGNWADEMSIRFLICLDNFRTLWGDEVSISTHPDALGRMLPPEHKSQHNFTKFREVRAGDFFPKGMVSADDCERAYKCALLAGFTGIGIYMDTKPGNMMHGDVRDNRTNKDPATWSRVNGKYLAISEVLPCLD